MDELLGMIATEALGDKNYLNLRRYERFLEKPSEELLSINCNLRLVRYPDGRMEWEEYFLNCSFLI
jgi:hypothetical protein